MAQGQKWEYVRGRIDRIIQAESIARSNFRALGIHDDWREIEENIYRTFCKLDHPTLRYIWLWEHFKLDTVCLPVTFPFAVLGKLVDPLEEVWFFINGDYDKFWFYQGKIDAIQMVIAGTEGIDELYLASKKFEWLLCINHHDMLIATGETMANGLRRLTT
jgi:hypothetical protein